MLFEELGLESLLLSGIQVAGFKECMPVQERVLPTVLDGNDVMVQSKTGSGKTAVFVISFLERFLECLSDGVRTSCLIVSPTRELAQQIASDARILSSGISDFKIGCFYGGTGYEAQEKVLSSGCDLYVGTPGRLLDFLRCRKINGKDIGTFVIDEADRLFDMGFYPDIQRMFSFLPPREKRQTMLFSATLSLSVRDLAWQYLNDAIEIDLEGDSVTVESIVQEIYHVSKSEKFGLFLQILSHEQIDSALIFTNSRYMAGEVARRLNENGFKANHLSGDMPQKARDRALGDFKRKKVSFLVATDVAARGLQIDNLPFVINYDLPEDCENYVHRIGRTARAGKSGKAISLADEEFVFSLESIEKFIKMKIPVIWPDNFPSVEDKSTSYCGHDRNAECVNGHSREDKSVKRGTTKPDKGNEQHRKPESGVSSGFSKSEHHKSLGSMTEEQRIEYYKKRYGFVPVNKTPDRNSERASVPVEECNDRKGFLYSVRRIFSGILHKGKNKC